MDKKELQKLIKESLMEGVSAEDQMVDTDEFEDSLGSGAEEYEDMDDDMNLGIEPIPMSSVDMPIQDKAYLNVGGNESYDDEFSDLNGYIDTPADDYENYEDDVSIAPGYFNENKVIKITMDELEKLIKEGVHKLHKKTIIENRLQQINQELNALNNPQAWEDARTEAKNQLKKKNIAWQEITTRGKIMSEASMMQKLKAKINGVDAEQKAYNEKHNLPLNWKGTKEGYHEYITNKKHHSGSN